MAKALNVPETEHTHGDLMLTVKAQELELVGTVLFPFSLAWIFLLFNNFTKFFCFYPFVTIRAYMDI